MATEVQRKLTTILAADAAGYSRLMQADEVKALGTLQAARGTFFKFIERHHGRVANTAGDGLIAEFPSVVEAVQCAIEVQRELGISGKDNGSALHFRIGIHLGDVMVDGNDLLGEGVNLAARLQAMADPGGILLSQQVYDQVQGKLSVGFDYLGEKRPKNFSEDVSVYGVTQGTKRRMFGKRDRAAPTIRPNRSTVSNGQSSRLGLMRVGGVLGTVGAALGVVNVASGSPVWAHYPAIALAALFGLFAAPSFVDGRFNVLFLRALIIAAALVVMNIVTWSGYFWAIWPLIGVVFLEVLRRVVFANR